MLEFRFQFWCFTRLSGGWFFPMFNCFRVFFFFFFSFLESANCHLSAENSICLRFKLSEDILLTEVSSAVVWFRNENIFGNDNKTHNFTITDGGILNMKARYNRNFVSAYHNENKSKFRLKISFSCIPLLI